MIKAVVDTNVIISAVIFGNKPEQILELAAEKQFLMITSTFVLSEVRKVLAVKFERDDTEIKRVIKQIASMAKIVNPSVKINKIPYKPDNQILECALEGKADYIVSGDKKHLLPLKKFEGIEIISPNQFLKILLLV